MRTWIVIVASFAVAGLLGVLHYAEANAVLQFVVAIVALALLAWTVGIGTETVGARYGPATTGVLQSTLGNLPELFIVIFALRAGEIVVAQTSILGSLLANALLVDGAPDRYFQTPHYHGHPILLVRMDAIAPRELAERIEDSWLLRAPKRLVDAFVTAGE